MQDKAVIVIVEILAVQDPGGLNTYIAEAADAIGPYGGEVIARGGGAVGGQAAFGPLAIQRWRSQAALDAWLASETYGRLDRLRRTSATIRVAVLPVVGPPAA